MPLPSSPLPHRLYALAAFAFPVAFLASGAAGAEPGASIPSPRAPVHCAGAVQHPITARVEALDPVVPGATVRFRLRTQSAVGLARAEARLVSAGRATLIGPPHVALGTLAPRTDRVAEFRIVLPASGPRVLLQFQVLGEGTAGVLTRGAVYNFQPEGASEVSRTATTGHGDGTVEVTARRIQP